MGCTGSIGRNVVEIVRANPNRLKIVAIAAGSKESELNLLARELNVTRIALASRDGSAALRALAAGDGIDVVVNAVVGAAGLAVTLGALDAGRNIALANKESLVMGGDLVMTRARERGVTIAPVDSEHSSLAECLKGRDPNRIRKVYLTASGGPFRGRAAGSFDSVTTEEALDHPTWNMGPKITIDSATMMNKGLEIIEAHHLFDLPAEKIDVVVHPQSIIHALVENDDGTIIAELAPPDMRIPIQRALLDDGAFSSPLDLTKMKDLTFEPPDRAAFPAIGLAYEALSLGGTAPAILNAANEVAVAAFLEKEIGFGSIADIISRTLERHECRPIQIEDDIWTADQWARATAIKIKDDLGRPDTH